MIELSTLEKPLNIPMDRGTTIGMHMRIKILDIEVRM